MKEILSFAGKTAFISGAAGGLGSVLVKKYAELGCRVIATDIDNEGLARLSSIKNVITRRLDVTNSEEIKILAGDLGLDEQGLDVLVCLAGIYGTFPVTEAEPGLLQTAIAVNFLGTAALIQVFLNALVKSKGRVIVVSSESYKIQVMFQPYMISKAALENYCRSARQELALKNVNLSVIRPGAIHTPLLKWMEPDYEPGNYPLFNKELAKSRKKSLKMVGNIAPPERVAGIIIKASMAPKPKWVYRINNNPLLTLVSMVPAGILDRLIIRILRSNQK